MGGRRKVNVRVSSMIGLPALVFQQTIEVNTAESASAFRTTKRLVDLRAAGHLPKIVSSAVAGDIAPADVNAAVMAVVKIAVPW